MNGEEIGHQFFESDEYTAINNRYFSALRRNGHVKLDPSGWVETLSNAASQVLPTSHHLPIGRYYMDEGDSLGQVRQDLHKLLGIWEGLNFDAHRFTACPSVGMASLLTLAVLRRKGVRKIIFETPCYFAAILQADWLGFEVVLIPTYRRDRYRRPTKYEHPVKGIPTAWWLTHPRVTLGFDQETEALKSLLQTVGRENFVVIDEALDQSFPSHFGQLHHSWTDAQKLIRLKGFGKPLGLNGYRLAFALHPAELRPEMIDCLETFCGGIDVHSLEAACAISTEPDHFKAMLVSANHQVVGLRKAAEKVVAGSRVVINPLVNGYIGSAIVDLSLLGPDQLTRRHNFLLGCQKNGMPIIIGPSMHFASDPPSEAVRLNFFTKREHFLRSVATLAEISGTII